MIRWDPQALLRFADLIEGHYLKQVRERKGFDSWGVGLAPGKPPSVLWVGDGTSDFGPDCWPFMAAHEALHSISTAYAELTDYQFLLFNICEDWRINQCLLKMYPKELTRSYEAMRQAILCRWKRNPVKLKSPVSQVLQHLCYMNHAYFPKGEVKSDDPFLHQMIWLRDMFADQNHYPVLPNDSDRAVVNQETCAKLINEIRWRKPPTGVSIPELRVLIQRLGYDLTFDYRPNQVDRSEAGQPKEGRLDDPKGGDPLPAEVVPQHQAEAEPTDNDLRHISE